MCDGNGRYSWTDGEPSLKLAVILKAAGVIVSAQAWIDGKGQQVLRAEAGLKRQQIRQVAGKQPSAN